MNKTFVLFVTFMMLLTASVNGQTKNVQDYTPSLLINKGQTEFKLFNSLYTQSQYFNIDSEKLDAGARSADRHCAVDR